MREMKESHIPFCENIPINWSEIPNKYIFSCHSTKVGDKSSEYQLLSLTTSGVKEKSTTASGGKVPTSYDGYQTVEIGDMIFCLFDLDCSAVFSGLSPYNGMITSAYDVLRANPNRADNHFLEYWFQYVFSNRYYKMFSKNIRYTVTGEMFNSIYTPIPPIEEQKKIGSYLDKLCKKVDALIANQEAQIEKLKAYKQSLITEVVTKGLDPNVPMKDSGVEWIGKIPQSWYVIKNRNIFRNKTVKGHGDATVLSVYRDWGVVPKDSRDDNWNVTSLDTDSYKYIEPGDLVINKMKAWSGSLSISDYAGIVSPAYYTCTVNYSIVDQRFIHHYLRNKKLVSMYEMYSAGMRIGQWDLSIDDFLGIEVAIPQSKEEQKLIADYLDKKCDKVDKLIFIKQQKIEKLNQYKKSLIYEYVTGKKEVM